MEECVLRSHRHLELPTRVTRTARALLEIVSNGLGSDEVDGRKCSFYVFVESSEYEDRALVCDVDSKGNAYAPFTIDFAGVTPFCLSSTTVVAQE